MNMDIHNNTTSNGALIGAMRESGWTMRGIASVVILTFGGLVTAPAYATVKQEVQKIQWHKGDSGNAAKLSAKLEEAHTLLTRFATQGQGLKAATATADISDERSQVHRLISDLVSLDKSAMDDFAATEAHIKTHNLPAVIEQRQQAAVKTYRARMDTLMAELKAADAAKDAPAFLAHVNKAKAHLDQVQVKPFHPKFDPNHLPFSAAKPTSQKPRLSKKDYQAHPVVPLKRVNVAANGSLMGIVTAATLGASVPVSPSDPSYIAPTDDVQITPAIQAEAAALHNDPVQIYNWVHNNVEYIPSYGSIQGSDMTLQTLKGNDFDQASLLIALLRAANIPSRYVYGTIQVPIAQMENWVGGVTDPNAALNLLGQGGVPVNAVVQGGQIKYAQLEHVWVEAWVNFIPSHAAKVGPGNTWVPMDASFKQYTYMQGMNLQQAVPFDANGIIQHMTSTASINSTLGSVSSADLPYLQQQEATIEQSVTNYTNSLSPTTTMQQLIGGQTIIVASDASLSASLPYDVVAVGQRLVALTSDLQDKFEYQLFDPAGSVMFDYRASTADLAGKFVAVSFAPASDQDFQLMMSYVPTSTASQFPTSVPGYLINLVPRLTINGVAVASGTAFPMGTTLQTNKGYWTQKDGWVESTRNLLVGQYQAVGLDLIGDMSPQLNAATQLMGVAQSAIQSGNTDGLNSYNVVESKLQANLLGYFAANDAQDFFSGLAMNARAYRAPSYGTFSMVVTPHYNFGVPANVDFTGYRMDIDHAEINVVLNGSDQTGVNAFNLAAGVRLSALEGTFPEQALGTPDDPLTGISAVAAISAAASAGQQIFSISQQNIDAVLPTLSQGPDVISRIQDVVSAGEVVTISQSPVSIGGWTGAGYLIQDPVTGTGAYEISGGANGADILDYIFVASDSIMAVVDDYTQGTSHLHYFAPEEESSKLGTAMSCVGGLFDFLMAVNQGCSKGKAVAVALFNYYVSSILQGLIDAVLAAFLPATLGLGVFFVSFLSRLLVSKLTDFFGEVLGATCDASEILRLLMRGQALV